MAGIYITIIALTIVAPLIINFCFLGYFYQHEKEEAMISTFDLVNRAAVAGSFDDEKFLDELEKAHANYSISVVVVDSAANVLLTTAHDTEDMNSQLYYAMFGKQMQGSSGAERSGDNYVIKQQMDHRLGEEYLVLWGTLDNGNIIMLRSAIEGIRESTNLTNRFLIWIGILALTLSILATFFLTRRITKPILALTDLSKRMIGLDFQAKYHSQKKRNEVDVLGEHMNELSETLEETIVELKQANHELQADIALKEENQKRQQEFISNVSHELKTPIALIQGYAEGLMDNINDDEESKEFYCEVIVDEARKMNQMVKKIMDLNQLEFGYNTVTMEHFDIIAMIRAVIAKSDILLKQKEINLAFDEDAPIYVWSDAYMSEEVFTNYLTNAINHADGEKRIDIQLEKKEKTVKITVHNTGEQIPEEDLSKLWDKFYKVDKARTREYGGSGVGLSIVKASMEQLGQPYGVYNCEDGVSFWFELDCQDAAEMIQEQA